MTQTLSYLKASGFPVGLLINFGGPKIEIKRLANTKNRWATHEPKFSGSSDSASQRFKGHEEGK
ncbi:MAG: hypothetical protein M1133_02305 [Armatimonadetes bacterium]|nr:hypothetical protein [Armatimonadota bacterium]